ncbi:MAG: D-alanine--D-alanine ligase [Gammaproteobacteria bacterium]|nr:MAG: D-alanine--D-alanine ligase [Gammaproteobacteria bacterium]
MPDSPVLDASMTSDFGKVAVLMGGPSAEHEISLLSGNAVLEALQSQGVDAQGFDAQDGSVLTDLQDAGIDRVFIALHGRWGEDGVIQGALEVLGIPYTGSGVLGSAIAMEKCRCKLMWQGAGLPTPEFMLLKTELDLAQATVQIGFPMAVKPSREGSSLGISKAGNQVELVQSWLEAKKLDDIVLAEKWITGAELTVAILDHRTLPVIKLETAGKFYDYEAKYLSEETAYICPSGLPAEIEEEVQKLAILAFDISACSGWGRVDVLLDEYQKPYLLEVNTVPGMTSHSLVPMAAKQAGMDFNQLVLQILETTDDY